MGEKMRKQKLVSVCAVEPTPSNELKYFYTKAGSSASTHLQTTVRAPINAHNLLMLEVYPESRDDRSENLPCIKLSFMLLCYGPNTRIDDMRYNFDQDYKHVEYVDFSGPIGSMRLAFELLQKFPRCKEVAFVLNDFNAGVPYEKDEDLKNLYQNWKVDTVKIIQDFSIVEKGTVELQSKTWRLDEILAGCQACFPNLKKLEVSIHGTGTNFDKVSNFVASHKTLSGNYLVEIINEKVRCKQKPPPTQKMLTSASTGTKAVSSMDPAKIAPIPVDLSIIKQEKGSDAVEQVPVPVSSISPYLPASINDHTGGPGGIQYPVRADNQIRNSRDRIGSNSNEGITPPPTPPALPLPSLPVVPYANSKSSEKETSRELKALCWKNGKGNASFAQHPLNQLVPPEMPSSSASFLSSKEVREKVQMQRLHSATSNSAYDSEIVDDEDVDERRIRMNRNPSPPVQVINGTPCLENRSSSFERPESYPDDMEGHDGQGRRIAPSPPVISRDRSLELRDPRLPYRPIERSRSRSGSRGRRLDRRSRSRSNTSRSRSRSSSSRKGYYRPRSRDYDRREYSDRSGDYRRRRPRSCSRSPGPSYYPGGEASRRGGYDDNRDRGSYRRNAKRPYYVNSSRRPRGRGSRGFRGRGGGRGRGRGYLGNRGGFKTSGYDNGEYFSDPRHQDDESYDDEGNDEQ